MYRTLTKLSISQVLRMYLENDGIEFSWSYLCLYILMVGGLAQQCNVGTTTRHYIIRPHLYCRVPAEAHKSTSDSKHSLSIY